MLQLAHIKGFTIFMMVCMVVMMFGAEKALADTAAFIVMMRHKRMYHDNHTCQRKYYFCHQVFHNPLVKNDLPSRGLSFSLGKDTKFYLFSKKMFPIDTSTFCNTHLHPHWTPHLDILLQKPEVKQSFGAILLNCRITMVSQLFQAADASGVARRDGGAQEADS